jgi:hypothetical protein
MLISDVSHNLSSGSRGAASSNGAAAQGGSYAGFRSLSTAKLAQLSVKEVLISKMKTPATQAVFLITVVTDNLSNEPIKLRIESFKNVHNDYSLPLQPAGMVAYCHSPEAAPTFLDYRILVIESTEATPDIRTIYQRVLNDTKYINIRNIMLNVVKVAPPTPCLMAVASDIILNLAARIIKESENKQLLYVRGTFDKQVDGMGTRYGLIAQSNDFASVKYQVEMV